MKRPSKKELKAAVDKLKDTSTGPQKFQEPGGQLSEKKSSQRIRKKGV